MLNRIISVNLHHFGLISYPTGAWFEANISHTCIIMVIITRVSSQCTYVKHIHHKHKHVNVQGTDLYLMYLTVDRMRLGSIVGSVGPLHGPGRQRSQSPSPSHASAGQPDRTEGEDQLGAILGRAARRSGGPGGRTSALLTRYAFGDDTIGSRGFITAITRTTWPRPFGGAGL
jgi:hypothetical protein